MGKTQSVRYNVAFDDFSKLVIFSANFDSSSSSSSNIVNFSQ